MARLSAIQRQQMVAQAALSVARDPKGLAGVNHGSVAKRCPIQTSARTVRHYFETQSKLQLECVNRDVTLTPQAVALGLVNA